MVDTLTKTLIASLLGYGLVACQQGSPPVRAAAAAPGAHSAAGQPAAGQLVAARPSPADSTLSFLRRHNLAPLWANNEDGENAPRSAMEGFYGTTPYRISFFFTRVEQDAREPNLFHVTGLDRYKKIITPFTGTIRVQAIEPFTATMFADMDSASRAFTALGKFQLNEDPTTKGAGNYSGQALLDFTLDKRNNLNHAYALDGDANPTKGCGLLFRGTQISNATRKQQPVAFASYYGAVVPQVLEKFGLGNRSEEVNPHLARFGWNELWENDEWWATSPEPSMNL